MAADRVSVPDLVGFGWDEASRVAEATGLSPHAVGPDGQPVNGRAGTVIDQQPPAGTRAARGSELQLRVAFGGGPAGDREPRVPLPRPEEFSERLDEPVGDRIPQARGDREPQLVGG